ncbi:thiosulfate reductase cytochrome B subunit [Escherichia coli]|uniref:thiosulfate reductase cytochrome B subunit n=1 Tax=Escherichia coli TaxID=562 RepID=UPI000BE6236A|nr:thiosulfate reductase cytochrome B subunit [Escherichia coli]
MNTIWGENLYYTPNYWSSWLMLAGGMVVLMIAGLLIHALLRQILSPKKQAGEEQRDYLYPRIIRCWHWSNALLFIMLLISGLCGHFSFGPVALMVQLHTWCGFALIIFWSVFVTINASTSNGLHYRVQSKGLIDRCWRQARFYLYGIMKGEPHPFTATQENKFNPLQQLTYLAIMYLLLPLLIITGLLALYPQITGTGPVILQLHIVLALMGILFICAHIYLCTLGDTPWQIFRSMIDGYHRHYHYAEPTASSKD